MIKKILGSNLCQISLLTLVVVMGMLWPFYPLERLEDGYYDLWAGRFKTGASPPMAMVMIDDKSLQAIGAWPWPRSLVADMVAHLSEAGTQTLGITLLYPQKELNPGLAEIQRLREINSAKIQSSGKSPTAIPDQLFSEVEKQLDHDARLIAAVKSATNVVMPFRILNGAWAMDGGDKLSGMLIINSLNSQNKGPGMPSGITNLGAWIRDRNDPGDDFRPIREPYKELAGKAGALGHLNVNVDPDGIVRNIPLLIEHKGRLLPSFALQMVIKHKQTDLKSIHLVQNGFQIDDLDIPTDAAYGMLFTTSPHDTGIASYSFVDVMNGAVAADQLKDTLVLLGLSGGEYARFYQTANGGPISEMALFGRIVSKMLAPRHITRPGWALPVEMMVVLYFSIFLIFVIPRVSLKMAGLILGIFLVTWICTNMLFLWVNGYWLKLFPPIILAICGFGLLGFKSYVQVKQQEKMAASKTLGLSFQEQGMLDMALEQFMQCPIQDPSVKDLLYSVGLDFERKRMANKALSVYEHIQTAGRFKDIKKRIEKLKNRSGGRGLPATNGWGRSTISMDDTDTHPTLGRYEILQELGRGAMGTVFLGRDPRINREVAVKTLPYAEIEAHELNEFKTRFFREAEAAGRLSHPNIVAIYDAGEEHDMAYIAMELLEGHELTAYCSTENLLPVAQVLDIIKDVASALEYAHRQGVVHRDIKPSNIMRVKDHLLKVTDFGIARVIDSSQTRTGITLGTPSYMSPEQVAGKKVDGRSDLFSLGIVFYELLTGKKPFAADAITSILYAITHADYPPISTNNGKVPPCCRNIVDKLLQKSLTKRFASASQVIKAIEACQARL